MPDLAYREVYTMNSIEARLRLVRTYQQTGSVRATARQWQTSRQVVRKRVARYQRLGEAGLGNASHRPRHSPHQTPTEVEEQVLHAWQVTHYGRQRLAIYLARQGLVLSPHTLRHILRRRRPPQTRARRSVVYPAHWAWEVQPPFALPQTDVKDTLDKALWARQLPPIRAISTYCAYRLPLTNVQDFLRYSQRWLYFYTVLRPHFGQDMNGRTPLQILQSLGIRETRPSRLSRPCCWIRSAPT